MGNQPLNCLNKMASAYRGGGCGDGYMSDDSGNEQDSYDFEVREEA